MSRVIWLPKAFEDLRRLSSFLKKHDPAAADKMVGEIEKRTTLLKQYSESGRPVGDRKHHRDQIIAFGAGAYILRYRIAENGHVYVIRIWHSREQRE